MQAKRTQSRVVVYNRGGRDGNSQSRGRRKNHDEKRRKARAPIAALSQSCSSPSVGPRETRIPPDESPGVESPRGSDRGTEGEEEGPSLSLSHSPSPTNGGDIN